MKVTKEMAEYLFEKELEKIGDNAEEIESIACNYSGDVGNEDMLEQLEAYHAKIAKSLGNMKKYAKVYFGEEDDE